MEDLRDGPDYQAIAEKAGFQISDYEDNAELWYYYKIDDSGNQVIMGEDYRSPIDAWQAACVENGLLKMGC